MVSTEQHGSRGFSIKEKPHRVKLLGPQYSRKCLAPEVCFQPPELQFRYFSQAVQPYRYGQPRSTGLEPLTVARLPQANWRSIRRFAFYLCSPVASTILLL